MGIVNATRERVKRALDIADTARMDAQIDDALGAATESVEGGLHRHFRPHTATKRFPYPNTRQRGSTWSLHLDEWELISVTSLTVGGSAVAAGDILLEPDQYGPPYDELQLKLDGTTTAFTSGDTWQRSIVIAGVWGYQNDYQAAGALESAIADTTGTTVDVTDGSLVGVGDVLLVDSELMNVTARTWLDTTENLAGNLTASMSDQTIAVADGSTYTTGELVRVNSETMEIIGISGNNLTVRRAVDGSVLAAHSTSDDLYAHRRLTVARGALGTTAATHADAAAVTAHVVPALVEQLVVAEALVFLGVERSGGASSTGSGPTNRGVWPGLDINVLWERTQARHGRGLRIRGVGA